MHHVFIIGGERVKLEAKFFYLDTILCHKHTKGMNLQPVTSYDTEKGYGTGDCPFCLGGPLHGEYGKLRTEHTFELAVRRVKDPYATLKPCIEEEEAVVYKVIYPHGGTRRFLTKDGAINKLAWAMIGEKHDRPTSIKDSAWAYMDKLHARLVRYLKFTMKEEG